MGFDQCMYSIMVTELLFAEVSTTTTIASLICSVGQNAQPSYGDNKDSVILTPLDLPIQKPFSMSTDGSHSQCLSSISVDDNTQIWRWLLYM